MSLDDVILGPDCSTCGETMELPVTQRDDEGVPTHVSIEGVEGWTFTTDEGWTCPAHDEHKPVTKMPMSSQWAHDVCEACGETWPCSTVRQRTLA